MTDAEKQRAAEDRETNLFITSFFINMAICAIPVFIPFIYSLAAENVWLSLKETIEEYMWFWCEGKIPRGCGIAMLVIEIILSIAISAWCANNVEEVSDIFRAAFFTIIGTVLCLVALAVLDLIFRAFAFNVADDILALAIVVILAIVGAGGGGGEILLIVFRSRK